MKLLRALSVIAAVVAVLGLTCPIEAADTTSAVTNAAPGQDSNEVLRAYLQLQEQLHATQLALEQNQKDASEAAIKGSEALNSRLDMLEHALAAQRARELETMQSSNRVMVIVAGSFAVIGFVAMLLMAYFQWRTVAGLAQLSTVLPLARRLGAGPSVAALDPGAATGLGGEAAEESRVRLLGALEQLEKRLVQLENAAPARQLHNGQNGHGSSQSEKGGQSQAPGESTSIVSAGRDAETAGGTNNPVMLLHRGEMLLAKDEPQAALSCFEEVLTIEPGNSEALVKKGTALERLQKLEEALDCYDKAIALDQSLTIAYLHKGGLCNRLERFQEALECYERALRSQEKRSA